MRSLAHQTLDELGGPWSILARQRRDHERLDALLARLGETPGAEQERVLAALARLVFPHAFAEESVIWPEVRRRLPDGEALTLEVKREHQEVDELWVSLEQGGLEASDRERVLERLAQLLRDDAREEEDELLPRLQGRVSVRRLRQPGATWEAVRRTAPTRPHPVVARRPPGNLAAALPLTLIDRGGDALDAGARRGTGRAAPALRAAGRGLARAAGRIERVGLLRRGEHPGTHRG